jgi:hypothetical protein
MKWHINAGIPYLRSKTKLNYERKMKNISKTGILFLSSFINVALLFGQTKELVFKKFTEENVIVPPADCSQWDSFRQDLTTWRADKKKELNYNDNYYRAPEFDWSNKAYSCYFLMMYDELIFDRKLNKYTPEKVIEYGEKEFGGFDCVILWQAYPRIGIDERNQFDFYTDMPGGLDGLKKLVAKFHEKGIKVMVCYNPWDTGTLRYKLNDVDALVELVTAIDADGIYLDTMEEGAEDLRQKLDKAKPGVVFDSEGSTPLSKLHNHHCSWGQWFKDDYVPGVIKNKWFERRHMVRLVERWDTDHSDELQLAWMNGCGIVVWENVFGTWNGWNEHDKSMIRLMLPVLRRYNNLFTGEGWMPLANTTKKHIFAHQWFNNDMTIWTIVNRLNKPVDGELMKVALKKDFKYFDLMSGKEIVVNTKDSIFLSGTIVSKGIAGFIQIKAKLVDDNFRSFLANQAKNFGRVNPDNEFPTHTAILKPVPTTKPVKAGKWNGEMVEIKPASGNQARQFMVRECGFYEPQTLMQLAYPFLHDNIILDMKSNVGYYAIDVTQVTNEQYKKFIDASGYKPLDTTNYLKHWVNGSPAKEKLSHPVVYVSLDDARAYAAWAGKRLPTEDEWQWAAIGKSYMGFPFNGYPDSSFCNMGQIKTTMPVKSFPKGISNFGCYDMCGNVFEWTESERTDGRIPFCIIKGGSYFKPQGSKWYTENGPLPSHQAVKYLLMYPGIDRCATIGFRCVVDLE